MRGFVVVRISVSILVLTGSVCLGTLVDVDPVSAQRFRSPAMMAVRNTVALPENPDHGYRHFARGGVELVFDAQLSAYVVDGQSDHYFHGKSYLWRHGDRWQMSSRIEGPWMDVSEAKIPRELRRHYAHKSREKQPAVPARQAP
jgi:hypothetical protein